MRNLRSVVATGLLGACVIVAGCHSAQSDWAKASGANTVAAYQDFLAVHPQDSHAAEAKAFILQYQDNNAWQEAQNAGSTASYQIYLKNFPQGTHAQDAQHETNRVASAAAWKSAQDAGTVAAVRGFLQAYPVGPDAEQAKAKLTELTAYRIHLATESSQTRADRRLARLQSSLGGQVSDLKITPDAEGKHFDIDSEGMTEQDAQKACDAFKKKRVACQVVGQ